MLGNARATTQHVLAGGGGTCLRTRGCLHTRLFRHPSHTGGLDGLLGLSGDGTSLAGRLRALEARREQQEVELEGLRWVGWGVAGRWAREEW